MKTDSAEVKNSGHAPSTARPAPNPLRLVILLGVLVVVAGALLYDRVIAPPRVYAANEKLHDTILKHNENGLKSGVTEVAKKEAGDAGGLLYSEDIQKIIGMGPTKVEKTEHYTLEHYCWWGWIPRNRNFITVLYIGNPEKRHYSTHTANAIPEDGLLPGKLKYDETPVDFTSDPSSASVAIPDGPPAGMMPGVKGSPGAGSGKAKGRPQGKANNAENESKGTDEGAKKGDESQKTDEPKTSVEPAKETTDESK